MHKETVNTFTKGMVKDTHPLTTPADILTDCLNGTIITYNGNEMILLNDMGNTLIGTAALPEGYIPIGVTEYGGIIYIASYNPATKKGQIGSFPSPLQAHMSEIWSVNVSTYTPIELVINFSNIFYENNSDNIIRTEYKAYLGRNENAQDVYILHTGDMIKIGNLELSDLQQLKCILLQFAILKNDGSIEIIEGDYLDGQLHVYTGKSSGYPLIIIKMLTLKSFNLERRYSRGDQDTVNVTFTGKPLKEDPNTTVTLLAKTTIDDTLPENYTDKNLSFTIENLLMEGSLKYKIVPKLDPQGNLVSMAKEGTIDLAKFKSDKAELKNWSYIILDTYMKINWSFDYYNLDDDKEIRKVTFKFISIIEGPDSEGIPIDLEKDSFNGSFEEIVNFEEGITKNSIYIVRIVGYKGENIDNIDTEHPIHLGSRMVYTSGILNQYYGKVKDFTNSGFKSECPSVMWNYNNILNPGIEDIAFRKTIEVKIKPVIKVTKTTGERNNITVTNPNNELITTNLASINSRTFTTKTNNRGNGLYVIDILNTYKFEVNLNAEVKYDNSIVGVVSPTTLSTILKSFEGSKLNFTDESQLIGTLGTDNLFTTSLENYNVTGTYDDNTGSLKFNEDLTLNSKMKVKASDVRSEIVERKGLRPLYCSTMERSLKDKCFTAWNKDNPLFCAGADENHFHYNVTLAGGGNSGGTSTGAGCDDTGLNTAMEQMGLPMVSMVAGMDGDEASYSPDEYSANAATESAGVSYYRRRTVAGWGCDDNEIDGGDNFLMTVWKLTDDKYRFSLLGSLKSYKDNRNGRLVRLDYMLRCLLSQIFTKLVYKETLTYVTTNGNEYAYYNPQVKVDVELESSPNINYNNVIYNGHSTNYDLILNNSPIGNLINAFLTANNTPIENDEIMIIKYDYLKTILGTNVVFATDFGVSDLSVMFSGASYDDSESDDKSNERWIYTVDWTAVDVYGRNKVYEFLSDNSINWKLDDLTPFLKLSGTKDGSGYAFVDTDGSYKVRKSNNTIESIGDPLSITDSNSPSNIKVNVVTTYNDNDYSKGGFTINGQCYGDVLRTWNNKEWPFYHSFQHVFKTYCQWKDSGPSSEIYNEIVINRDSGHIGELNICAMWRNNKDEDAPDMVGALGNSYNSIYAVTNPLYSPSFTIQEPANYMD